MSHFHKHPSGQRISGTELVVEGNSVTIGLWGYHDFQKRDLIVVAEGNDLMIPQEVGTVGDSKLWKLTVSPTALATKGVVKDKIYANTVDWHTWDSFNITFKFKPQAAASLIVRPITQDVYGGPADVWRSAQTAAIHVVDSASFKPGTDEPLNFRPAPAQTVHFSVFAAKIGSVERAYILMTPATGHANKLLVVISHSFGQNEAYYGALGYQSPLSAPLIKDVTQRFVMERWGSQLMSASKEYALLMPVRAKGGGGTGELGPFSSQSGMGTKIIGKIQELSKNAFDISQVDVVTFSNGIGDANQFIGVGGKGLPFKRACNQDPAHGGSISAVPQKKQYISGQTTSGAPRAGFEFLPLKRWVNEPNFLKLWTNEPSRFNYLHTWCLPHYTLYMAMTM